MFYSFEMGFSIVLYRAEDLNAKTAPPKIGGTAFRWFRKRSRSRPPDNPGRDGAFSTDSRYVVYTTRPFTSSQVNRFDRVTNEILEVSKAVDGTIGTDSCYFPSISGSGQKIVFVTESDNLHQQEFAPLVEILRD